MVGVLGVLPALGVQARLVEARTAMQDARTALLGGEPADAARAFRAAQASFGSARDSLGNPFLRVLSWLPVVGRTPDATSAIVEAGDRTAGAGEILASALEEIPGGLSALVPRNGRIPIAPLEELAEPLGRASVLLGEAQVAMEDAPRSWLLGPVADAQEEFGPLVDEAAGASAVAADLAGQLPAFLGADGPKRYFLGAQNPAELRGTGGIIGSFTIMTVDNGEIELGEFRSVQFLSNAEPEDLPPPNPDYGRLYEEFEAWTFWAHVNRTPDFPSAATAIENLYEHLTGEPIDGALVVDPFALADLMRVGGAVQIPTLGVELTPDETVDFLTNEAYSELAETERKQILGEAAKGVIERFLAGSVGGGRIDAPEGGDAEKIAEKTGTTPTKGTPSKSGTPASTPGSPGASPSPGGRGDGEGNKREGGGGGGGGLQSPFQLAAAARALVETASAGHLLAHSADPDVQRAFEEAGIAGSLRSAEGDVLGVIANNGAGNKTDFYVKRAVEYTVQLGDDGSGTGYARVSLENDAPTSGQPRTVIGPYNEDFEPGENRTQLTAYCAPGCGITGVSQSGEAARSDVGEELGFSRAEALVDLRSGESELLEYSWTLDEAWDDEKGVYRLTYLGQPTIKPTRLRVEVIAPPGVAFSQVSPGMEIDGDRAVWEGEVGARTTLEVEFDTSLVGRIVRFFQDPVF